MAIINSPFILLQLSPIYATELSSPPLLPSLSKASSSLWWATRRASQSSSLLPLLSLNDRSFYCRVHSDPAGGAAELRRRPVFLQPGAQLPSLCLKGRLGMREITYLLLKMPGAVNESFRFPSCLLGLSRCHESSVDAGRQPALDSKSSSTTSWPVTLGKGICPLGVSLVVFEMRKIIWTLLEHREN